MAVNSRDCVEGEDRKEPWTRPEGMPYNDFVREDEPGKFRGETEKCEKTKRVLCRRSQRKSSVKGIIMLWRSQRKD